ncbi:carboxypeptidase B-like [Plodia interpunctella]|uniref:carboxypeptidase B-like n=1 Tax=Plodia interpunctella TaxID=58824 RepID=UPI0023675C67|nr:carboxypeptidase B-like [Plodia interpunctella]
MLFKLCVLFFVVCQTLAKNELYSGYKVYNIKLETVEQEENFRRLKRDGLDFWRHPSFERNTVGRVMVAASHLDWFEKQLKNININVDIHISDVLDYLCEKDPARSIDEEIGRAFDYNDFYRYDEILNYIEELQATYASSLTTSVEVVDFGTTSQNRRLVYMKINRRDSDVTKPVVIIEAGINPREWITIPSALNVVNNILDETHPRFLSNFDWVIIPVVNPDGYEYTHTNLRLWEKTRSTNSNLGAICPGVNINRNFDIDWGFSGSSSSPCSNNFAGIAPLSETESQMIVALIEEYGPRVNLYISLQNNGVVISYPWHYERAASAMFVNNHILGIEMINSMVSNYTLGVAAVVLDRISGTSSDYVRMNGVRHTYNIHIEHSEEGSVVIPANDIARIVDDVWTAISVAADNVLN